MKVLIVHNAYGRFSGEEAVIRDIKSVLKLHGHDVISLERSSAELNKMRFGALRAFFSGLYNPFSRRKFRKLLETERPDIIHVHNLFPFISPSILFETRQSRIPVIMTVHNYRLDCPNGLYYSNGEICERCHGGKEYWCILKNCEQNYLKSFGYALRNWVARMGRAYLDNVTIYACLTKFQKNKLAMAGYPIERLSIIPNMVQMPVTKVKGVGDPCVGYVGRMSKEKGVSVLVDSAKNCLDISFVAAGGYDALPGLEKEIPPNFKLLGYCKQTELAGVYKSARFIVLPSVCYEGFPTVLVEAMLHGKAIVCSKIGGLPEIVADGVTGLLVEPGNADDLADKIRYLWERPELCKKMGEAGREKALKEYSQGKYYKRLLSVYNRAISECKN